MRAGLRFRNGFATATAMCILAVAGVAMAGVGMLLASDVRRTLNGTAEVQLRQLLIAAEIDAPSHLSDSAQSSWTTPVPPSLATDAAMETHRLPLTDGVTLHVTARLAGRVMSEDLRYLSQGDGWKLTGTQLSNSSIAR